MWVAPQGTPWCVLADHGGLWLPMGWYRSKRSANAALAAFTRWLRR